MCLLSAVLLFLGCSHDLDQTPPCTNGKGCEQGETCVKGTCVRVDAGSTPDAATEAGAPDVGPVDLPAPDLPRPDLPPPDVHQPDMSLPDLPQPDMPLPDLPQPDLLPPQPDQQVTKALVDETFSDFVKGTLSESGAKAYISKKGNVQLLDRLDLNGDGLLDIVICNGHNGKTSVLNSYVYWGSKAGFSKTNRLEVSTLGAVGSASADLDDDGYPELIIANGGATGKVAVNSYIYWGQPNGAYTSKLRTELPTVRGGAISVADLDADGYLDVVFSNYWDGTNFKINSYIYWGQPKGAFSTKLRTGLPTQGAEESAIADLDKDGDLDIVFVNYADKAGGILVNSYIYWGKKGTYSSGNRTGLPTMAGQSVAIADLNSDGDLDIVFEIGRAHV